MFLIDEYEIGFSDGSSTLIWVSDDDSVQDTIVALCEELGVGVDEVVSQRMTRTETSYADGSSEIESHV